MNKERFTQILKEYNYTSEQIEMLWQTKPPGEITEGKLRATAQAIAPEKDNLIQH